MATAALGHKQRSNFAREAHAAGLYAAIWRRPRSCCTRTIWFRLDKCGQLQWIELESFELEHCVNLADARRKIFNKPGEFLHLAELCQRRLGLLNLLGGFVIFF